MAYDATKEEKHANPYEGLTRENGQWETKVSAAPLAGGQAGPTGTGHVNFDQIYNANAGTSAREAQKLQTSARAKGNAAQAGLTGAQAGFDAGVRTGSVAAPTDAQRAWAATGNTGVTKALGTGPTAPGAVNPSKPGGSPDARTANAPPTQVVGGNVDSREKNAQQQQAKALKAEGPDKQAVEQGAAGGYTGPDALSALAEYAKLAQDTAAAQDEANALASGNEGIQAQGMNQLDASLLGAAGREGFEDLGRRYGGLKGQLDQANVASKGTADAARKQSNEAVDAYKQLLGEYEGRVDADTKGVAANESDLAMRAEKAKQSNQDQSNFREYLHGGSDLDHARNTLHTIARATDVSDWVTGGDGLVTKGTNALSPMSSTNTGNVWGGWTDNDYDVWASMTDSDWSDFAGLSDADKHAWINARRAKLNGGG